MPRQIEQELIDAIRAAQPFAKRHHAYDPATRRVSLYGVDIVELAGVGGVALWASLSGHNTPRTRQVINAVAKALTGRVALTVQAYQPYAAGRRVGLWEWFPVMEGPAQAPTASPGPRGEHGEGRAAPQRQTAREGRPSASAG